MVMTMVPMMVSVLVSGEGRLRCITVALRFTWPIGVAVFGGWRCGWWKRAVTGTSLQLNCPFCLSGYCHKRGAEVDA